MMFKAVFLLVGISLTMASGSGPIGSPDEVPAINLDLEWKNYMNEYGKSYKNSRELNDRRRIWEDKLAIINQHNEEAAQGKHTYTMGVNKFTDLTFEEFSLLYLSPPRKVQTPVGDSLRQVDTPVGSHTHHINVRDIAKEKDWRNPPAAAVTSVKDQEPGGTCYAFAAVGSIEGQRKIIYGKLESLSAQMLVDCCTAEGVTGCDGGLVDEAFDCVKNLTGIVSERSYPYNGTDQTCKFKPSDIVAKIKGYKRKRGQPSLAKVLNDVGPASVYIKATERLVSYKKDNYTDGVFFDPTCNGDETDHAVLAVGYGDKYWLIKNSWGPDWGMDGYFKIKRTDEGDGECKIASEIIYPYLSPVSLKKKSQAKTSGAIVSLQDFSHVLITSILVKIINALLG